MAFDVEAAKAEGYTDEEIQAYLRSQGMTTPESQAGSQPVPPVAANAPIDRSAEQTALAQGAGIEAAKYAAGLGAAGLAYKGLKDIIRGPVAPPPEMPPGATQRTLSSLASGANRVTMPAAAPSMNPPTASPSYVPPAQAAAAQEAQQISRANQIVRGLALDKLLKGGVGAGFGLYHGGLNTNEQQELARRRGMAPTITGQ